MGSDAVRDDTSSERRQDAAAASPPPGAIVTAGLLGTARPFGRSAALYLALLAGLALLLTQVHAYTVNLEKAPRYQVRRHQEILDGSGKSPYVYRQLVPRLAEATRPLLARLGVDGGMASLDWSYVVWRGLFTFAFLVLFHLWLTAWLDPPWAVAGTLLVAALHPPSYLFYWFQPDSALDYVVWTAAALISLRPRGQLWLLPLVAVGTLNRETALFAVAIHLALRWGEEPAGRLLARTAALGATWAAVFLGLRLAIGWQEQKVTVAQMLGENFAGPGWAIYALSFFGALWFLPFVGWHRRPAPLRRLAVGLAPYLALQPLFGRIRETRLILPLALVLVPLALLALRQRMGGEGGEGGGAGAS